MRPLVSALCFLFFAAAHGQTLQQQVATLAQSHAGKVAVYAEDLTTHASVALSPDTPVQTASTIKLLILLEAVEQIRAGHAHLEDRLTLAPADRVPGSGILTHLDAPLELTFKDVLTLMIALSDNTATNLAIDRLGVSAINARAATLGLRQTHLYKKVFTPVATGTILPDDFKQFGLGKTTPREITQIMRTLATCSFTPPSLANDAVLCNAALAMLYLQQTRTGIPYFLDALPGATGTSIANKTGALDAVRSDVGAVSTPHGLVLLALFTYDNKDRRWIEQNPNELFLATLARTIVSAWSPQGLAPWPKK